MEFSFWMMVFRLYILLDRRVFGTSGMFGILIQEEGFQMKKWNNTWV
ncbi:hypothetical protein [Peribacillus saganii]|nr:hypothetical protein [Peribacillus saganii]